MDAIKKGTAFLLSVAFVITAVMALLLFNLDMQAFSPELYQRVFANESFYERIPVILGETLASYTQNESLPLTMKGLNAQGWATFLRALLPPETLKAMGDQVLTSAFAYLNDETDTVTLSLIPLKAAMQSDLGVQAVLGLMQTQPDCNFQQVAQMTLAILSEQQLSLCNPPSQITPIITPLIQLQLQVAAAVIPNEVTITAAPDPGHDPRDRLKIVRLVMRLSPLLPLAFLLLITMVIVRSLQTWLNWWGFPLLVSGFIAAFMGLTGAPVLSLILRSVLESRARIYLPSILLESANQLAAAIVDALLRPVLWEGLALFTVGLVMFLIAWYWKGRQPKELVA